jgi:lysophospholipase L1-like esterase
MTQPGSAEERTPQCATRRGTRQRVSITTLSRVLRVAVIAAALSLSLAVSSCGSTTPGVGGPSVARHRLSVSVVGPGRVTASGIDCATRCAQSYPRAARALVGFGHSVMAGYGSTNPATHSWMALVASKLGATDNDNGVDGAVAAFPEDPSAPPNSGNGGYAYDLSIDNPGTNLKAAPPQVTAAVMFGFNDLTNLGGPERLGPFKQALTTILARVNAVAAFAADSPSVSAASGWTTASSKNVGSGSTMLAPQSAGARLTIKVPASFQGGTIALGFTAKALAPAPTGAAVYGVQVDGGPARVYTIDATSMVTPIINGDGGWIGTVDRLGGLAPGAHTITVALQSSSGTVASYFNYWEAEAPLAQARPIIVPEQYDLTPAGYGVFAAAHTPYVPSNAGVAALNAMIRRVAAGFPANVQSVRLSLGRNKAHFYTDGAHPSNDGYVLIAREIFAALQTVTLHATPTAGARFTGWRGAGCSGTGTCTVKVKAARHVTAHFARH